MPSQFICHLTDRALINITGPDTEAFLQDLITNDLSQLGKTGWLYASLLTPQGKVLFDFFLTRHDDGFYCDCARAMRDDLMKRLTFYKLRADVHLAAVEDGRGIVAIWPQPDKSAFKLPDGMIIFDDPRLLEAGLRGIISGEKLDAFAGQNGLSLVDLTQYHAHRLSFGLADSIDIGSGERFVHECNFDQLNGVSFSKGCYIGQEVVSRVEHRATARKRMIPVKLDPADYAERRQITANDRPIGDILSHSDTHALALIRLDLAEKAQSDGVPLMAGAAVAKISIPDWANFDNSDTKKSA